jgi:branched-chain amino acid transport system substrate-binding protein
MSRGLPVRSGWTIWTGLQGLQGSLLVAIAVALLGACATVPDGAEAPQARRPDAARPQPTDPVAREAPLRVGLVLSQTGSQVMQRYAEQVREGAELAAANAGRPVELVVLDDGGTPAGAERAIRELEAQGISVVVGPLLDEALTAAARARSNDALLLISPTAVAQPGGGPNAYALNVVDERGATALGEHARRHGRVGVLYERTPEETRQARAFMDAYRQGGGTLTDAGFGPGTTNVSAQLTRLQQAGVDAIYFPASDRALNLVLPQIEFYGLVGAQLYGSEAWLGEAARNVPARLLEGAVLAISLPRESAEVGWQDFVELYENAHRRTLDSPVPALGYDAVQLAVRRLTGVSGEHRGATGVLTVQPDRITRRAFLVRIQSGRLVPVN